MFGLDADVVEAVSVMEGESVTLNPEQGLQGIFFVEWKFGDKASIIAEIDNNKTSYPELNYIFGGRLKLNQTGSLTINNMRTKHNGLYKVQIDNRGAPSKRSFTVNVYGKETLLFGIIH